jgi:hypothetical protein
MEMAKKFGREFLPPPGRDQQRKKNANRSRLVWAQLSDGLTETSVF